MNDNSVLVSGVNPDHEVYEISAKLPAGHYTSIRLQGLVDDSLPQKGAGRSENGNVVLSEFEAEFSTPDLRQVDPLEFGRLSQPPMPDLQRAVKDGRVSVVRNVTVIPVLLSGKDGTPREATPASLTVVRSNQESIQYSEIVQ